MSRNNIEKPEESSFLVTNNIFQQSFKHKTTLALNHITKIRQDQNMQSGEFALHQIFQQKKNQIQIKKLSTKKNL